METACSIIPDTGTTLVVGPEAQIASLYEDLCNNWQRCKNTHKDLAAATRQIFHGEDWCGANIFSITGSKGPRCPHNYWTFKLTR
jgi:hypothetical protein